MSINFTTGTKHVVTSNSLTPCKHCNEPIPLNRTNCPHCANPMLFPNVRMAQESSQKKELEERFLSAINDAKQRGCEPELVAFSDACKTSKAVFNCSLEKLFREIATGTDIFETYYDLERLCISVRNSRWIKLGNTSSPSRNRIAR